MINFMENLRNHDRVSKQIMRYFQYQLNLVDCLAFCIYVWKLDLKINHDIWENVLRADLSDYENACL